MIEQLNPLLRGWGNYFAVGDVMSMFEDLDQWIRMRLRSKAFGHKVQHGDTANRLTNRALAHLGLVSMADIRRTRLSLK